MRGEEENAAKRKARRTDGTGARREEEEEEEERTDGVSRYFCAMLHQSAGISSSFSSARIRAKDTRGSLRTRSDVESFSYAAFVDFLENVHSTSIGMPSYI